MEPTQVFQLRDTKYYFLFLHTAYFKETYIYKALSNLVKSLTFFYPFLGVALKEKSDVFPVKMIW